MKNSLVQSIDLYNHLIKALPGFKEYLNKEIKEVRKILKKSDTALDAGCGWGREIKSLAGYCRKMVGIDKDEKEVFFAKQYLKGIKNVELFARDAKKTLYPKNSFDVVFLAGSTLGNLNTDKDIVFEESKRVLKPGGKILISVFYKGCRSKRLRAYKKMGFKIKKVVGRGIFFEDGYVSEEFSKRQLQKICKKHHCSSRFIQLGPIGLLSIVEPL